MKDEILLRQNSEKNEWGEAVVGNVMHSEITISYITLYWHKH